MNPSGGPLPSALRTFQVALWVSDRPAPVCNTHGEQQPGLAIATAESGCSITDWTCICTSSAYTVVAAEFEDQYCSPADRQGNFAVAD